ncbi:hypothetical protein CMUS01_09657 [Colletotrichum musicola]|uniref:Uncharacterized protein n=1 Tax=Colletotrichum musicola TaxID=2175873 RepID=A0A8H6NAV5_9PEZI|nr:hypothetical protein CMUS01_09657 [Colletotrichum musicola]
MPPNEASSRPGATPGLPIARFRLSPSALASGACGRPLPIVSISSRNPSSRRPRYIPADKTLNDIFAAFRCLFPVFESGHLLNQTVFPVASATAGPIHPLDLPHLPWTDEDADLTGAVVLSLSAARKTGRNLA